MADKTCDIGLIGLAVMGQNLVLNMNDHGYRVAVFNRTVSKVDDFINDQAKGSKVTGAHSIEEMCRLLKTPRRVMMMVKAGQVVDQTIEQIVPHLEKGDIIIDGGNSLHTDSERRTKDLAEKGILFVGSGVSGGEEGARHGPSIMPGGNPEARKRAPTRASSGRSQVPPPPAAAVGPAPNSSLPGGLEPSGALPGGWRRSEFAAQ